MSSDSYLVTLPWQYCWEKLEGIDIDAKTACIEVVVEIDRRLFASKGVEGRVQIKKI